jgi:hypothetical protein
LLRAIVLAFTVVLAAAAAGCTDKRADPTPTPTTTPSPTNTTSPSPTPTTSPQPRAPEEILKKVLKYQTGGNDADASFGVDNGTSRFDVKFWVNTTTTGAYQVAAPGTPPTGNPYVVLINPSNQETKIEFTGTQGVCSGDSPCKVYNDPFTRTLDGPGLGTWKAGIRGSGSNVQVDIQVVARFA